MTRIEVLAAVVICITLVALIVPAVQTARESARRAQCKDQLKQLGLACHAFHDANGHFPVGRDSRSNATWGIQVLPYLDQKALAKNFITDSIAPDEPALFVVLEQFRCPSETGRETKGISNYLGNWGAGDSVDSDILAAPSADGGGIFVQDLAVRIRDIRDGTTNTILIGEALGLEQGERDHDPQQLYEWGGQSIAEICGDTRLPINAGKPTSFQVNNFSSNHQGGAQFVVADGAVRFMSENINYEQTNYWSTQGLYQNMSDRHDCRIVADAWGGD